MEGSFQRTMQPLIAPVYKAGLVLIRTNAQHEPEICLTQVDARNPDEQHQVDFGLPKGMRMYCDPADGEIKDARDPLMAGKYKETLEPLNETVARECEEEIGLPAGRFYEIAGTVHELGVRLFESRDKQKAPFEIMWYVAEADAATAAAMHKPTQARTAKWFTLGEMHALEKEQRINPHYVRVVEEAFERITTKTLTPTRFEEPTLEPVPAPLTR